jgi:hypothetical protein
MDVITVFLNCILSEELYISHPKDRYNLVKNNKFIGF